jgi:hypothetical protein
VDCRVTGCACGRSRVVKYVDAGAFTECVVDTCTVVFVDSDSCTECVVDSVRDTIANTVVCPRHGSR